MHFLRGEMRDRIGIWPGIVPNIKAGVRPKMVQNITRIPIIDQPIVCIWE